MNTSKRLTELERRLAGDADSDSGPVAAVSQLAREFDQYARAIADGKFDELPADVRDWNLLEIKELERAEFLIDKSTVLNNGKNNYAKNA